MHPAVSVLLDALGVTGLSGDLSVLYTDQVLRFLLKILKSVSTLYIST